MAILQTVINWDAVAAIASAIASIAALITIAVTLKNERQNDEDRQFTVQPWFHITSMSKMGGEAPINLILMNDASPNIKITGVDLKVDGFERTIEIQYKYLKKDDRFAPTGKCFELSIKHDPRLFGKKAMIEIEYTNLYKKRIKSISPLLTFVSKENDHVILNIQSEGFLYIPFSNEIAVDL